MAAHGFLLASLVLSFLAETCYGVTFSSLQRTLVVTSSPKAGEVLKAGQDQLTVTWSYNQTFPAGTDSAYKTTRTRPASSKSSPSPTAPLTTPSLGPLRRTYPPRLTFVRAYVYNSNGDQAAFGQTTNTQKTTNLFEIQAITGRHVSLDIASVCFSAFSIVSLFGFFYMEKRKANLAQQK
ncbi:nitrate transmembrane transporter [Actinidia rufa]|uniref:Nitrate transmembrane transporter n=1 Tax=Actinidia rufa TaxID=165716 RepID=A0A7J0GAT6_9ERIC|nr:nitrate transmembrane transporter [Actinidia rufa]